MNKKKRIHYHVRHERSKPRAENTKLGDLLNAGEIERDKGNKGIGWKVPGQTFEKRLQHYTELFNLVADLGFLVAFNIETEDEEELIRLSGGKSG